MFGNLETEALVVGAGPTGLLAALQLVQEGLAVEIIDEQWGPAGHSYALALHASTLQLLDAVGIADEAIALGRQIPMMSIFDGGERCASVPLGGGGQKLPFVLSLPQSALERLLAARLAKAGVRVRWSHRLAGLDAGKDGVVARVERLAKESSGYAVARTAWVIDKSFEVRAGFVIGADGHHSAVRRALDLPFPEVGPSQTFAVFECSGGGGENEMRLVIDDATVNVLWPLPGGRARWSLELNAPEVAARERFKSRLTTQIGERFFHHLEEEDLRAMLRDRAPWFEPTFHDLGWSIEVRFERRLASRTGGGRAWLVGDAAHLTGPAGMQSMNAGLEEAVDLASRMAQVAKGKAGLDVLEEYEKRVMSEWRFLHGAAGGLKPKSSAAPFIATNAARLLPCLPGTREELDRIASQLSLSVDRG